MFNTPLELTYSIITYLDFDVQLQLLPMCYLKKILQQILLNHLVKKPQTCRLPVILVAYKKNHLGFEEISCCYMERCILLKIHSSVNKYIILSLKDFVVRVISARKDEPRALLNVLKEQLEPNGLYFCLEL